MTRAGRTGWLVLAALLLQALPASAQLAPKGPLAKRRAERNARRLGAVERFNELSPEERERMLKRLPEQRRRQVEANLERYKELTPEQKQRLSRQYENFQSLPPERQQAARKLFRELNQLPAAERQQVRREVVRMRRLSEEDRKERLTSEEFRSRFPAGQRRMIEELSTFGAPDSGPDPE